MRTRHSAGRPCANSQSNDSSFRFYGLKAKRFVRRICLNFCRVSVHQPKRNAANPRSVSVLPVRKHIRSARPSGRCFANFSSPFVKYTPPDLINDDIISCNYTGPRCYKVWNYIRSCCIKFNIPWLSNNRGTRALEDCRYSAIFLLRHPRPKMSSVSLEVQYKNV
mgnify:CR=1 FL=1